VTAVDVTADPYDAYEPDVNTQRFFALEFDPTAAGCAQLLDFEYASSDVSTSMSNVRFVTVVVEDNQPEARRLELLDGHNERHAAFRRRLLASRTVLGIEIQPVDEQVVVRAGVQTPVVYAVDENEVPQVPIAVTSVD